ncbi:hypothetical protein [Criblamydia sequanensis]|nr:hypothetical protein [Criblamydia sequanensis]
MEKKMISGKETLHQALDYEISVLRELLASFFEEERALLEQNKNACGSILENRLELMKHLETCHPAVMKLTLKFAKDRKISLPKIRQISYSDSFKLLKSCLIENDVELLTQCTQIEAIIDTIVAKSDRIGQLIKNRVSLPTPPVLKPIPQEKTLPKTRVSVIGLDEKEE